MTPDDIDKLTIAEVRAIAERASEALRTLQVLGLAPMRVPISADANLFKGVPIHTPLGPFPCGACGRVAPERPGEALQVTECQACGNHLPGTSVLSNKGPVVWSAEEIAKRRATPAFDVNGEPVAD